MDEKHREGSVEAAFDFFNGAAPDFQRQIGDFFRDVYNFRARRGVVAVRTIQLADGRRLYMTGVIKE